MWLLPYAMCASLSLVGMYLLAVFDWFFPIHMLLICAALLYTLHRKLEWAPRARKGLPCAAGPSALNLIVVEALAAFGLMSSDQIACGTDWAWPHMHAFGQVFAALALYTATVLSAYLRLQERGYESDILYHAGFVPVAARVEKERKQ
jgi:hypothetical protein